MTVLLSCAVVFSAWARSCEPNHGKVQIVNAADTPVSGEVDVCSYEVKFSKLAVGSSVTFDYDIGGGQDYHVMVTLGDGRKLDKRVGYIDSWFDSNDKIIIRSNDVEIGDLFPRPIRHNPDDQGS